MPNPQPIKDYLKAVQHLKAGERIEACQALSRAIGASRVPATIEHSIGLMLTPGSLANENILKMVASEVAKGGTENG